MTSSGSSWSSRRKGRGVFQTPGRFLTKNPTTAHGAVAGPSDTVVHHRADGFANRQRSPEPLEREGPNCGLRSLAPIPPHVAIGPRPEGVPNGLIGIFLETLAQKLGTGRAPEESFYEKTDVAVRYVDDHMCACQL